MDEMQYLSFQTHLIVCPLVFLAGFVDAIAGGGGLISMPAYLLAGLPAHYAMGTSKIASSFGTFTAALRFIKSGQINWKASILAGIGSFLGSLGGSAVALMISDEALKLVMLLVLPAVAVFLLIKKDFGISTEQTKPMSAVRLSALSLTIGLVIGGYDGLIGPGTGTFLVLALTGLLGFDLLKSSGCAKVVNLMSNIASMIVFTLNKKAIIALAIPAAVFSMAGYYLGARLAVAGGSKYVRYTIFLVIGLLFIKLAADLFF